MKYRKKPVVIEAIQLQNTEKSILSVLRFMGQKVELETEMDHCKFEDYCNIVRDKGVTIRTLEGDMTASVGDYIIKGVNGEFYPCKPDIFEKTYDYVSEEKPPIGLIPQKLFLEGRLQDIFKATLRYEQAKKEIPQEWEKEAEEIQNYIENKF